MDPAQPSHLNPRKGTLVTTTSATLSVQIARSAAEAYRFIVDPRRCRSGPSITPNRSGLRGKTSERFKGFMDRVGLIAQAKCATFRRGKRIDDFA
jgi:hypothetical protein